MSNFSLRRATALAALLLSGAAGAQGLGLKSAPGLSGQGSALMQTPQLPATPQAALSGGGSQGSDGIAAVVGSQVITQYDLDLRVRAAEQQIAQQRAQMPPIAQLRAELLNQLIDQVAMAQYAEDSGIVVSAEAVDRAIAQVAAGYKLSTEQFRKQITAEGLGWSEYKEQVKREVLIGRLRQQEVAARIKISDQEVDDYLAKQAKQPLAAQTQIQLAQIFIPLPSQPTPEQVAQAKVRIDEALGKLRQGRDFSKLAMEYSQGPEAKNGVNLGVRPASQWPGLFMEAIRGLKPGEISGVIRSPAGFHILKLVAEQGGQLGAATAMQSRVSEIVLDVNSGKSRQAAVKELASIRDAVEQGKVQFADKARELSQDVATGKKGGDLGWVLPGQLPPALDAALNRLNPGQVSQPITLPGKVVLLQLVDRREHALGKDQERAVARNILLQQKEEKDFNELVKDVRARTYVRIPDADS
ncbi:Chaperone SurA [Thiomonas sp. X19]|uniref:peptidylprolyl isomerase n=1 Tax=Thiomonas sp. X19 TaxID=1050370 RepID=UPI000B728AC7|nr:peptidylprolyl isomerase [Thiomonas sp. X19]SCC91255.1 Chaperone SurA [Thiomonas sp. X19]